MTKAQQTQLAQDTYDLLLKDLKRIDPSIELKKNAKDPAFVPKAVCKDVMRIRIFPRVRQPADFWDTKACFYEIGVGPYQGTALCLGGVQFFQYANQKRCGGGRHTAQVQKILKRMLTKAPKGFSLALPAVDGKFHFEKRYSGKDYGRGVMFPCADAAADLAWLIANSLPQFSAL
jgi:hypothetical protein